MESSIERGGVGIKYAFVYKETNLIRSAEPALSAFCVPPCSVTPRAHSARRDQSACTTLASSRLTTESHTNTSLRALPIRSSQEKTHHRIIATNHPTSHHHIKIAVATHLSSRITDMHIHQGLTLSLFAHVACSPSLLDLVR